MVHALWNKSPGWEAGLVLGTFSIVLAVPGMFSPLDWNRYYLFRVIFSRVHIAIGLAKVFSVVIPKIGTMLKTAPPPPNQIESAIREDSDLQIGIYFPRFFSS